jgi:predicted dithiol-disulfide oxidoreductase (DUF899 family)
VFGWPEHACRGCSLGADQVAHLAHLNVRDTTLAYASRAPQADIARLKARMGWEMPWLEQVFMTRCRSVACAWRAVRLSGRPQLI